MKKRALSFLLTLLLALSLLPGAALADGGSGLNGDVIDTIVTGVRNWATEIDISQFGVREDEIKSYIINIAYDHPEFFYVFNKYNYKKSGDTITKLIPVYDTRFSKSDIATFNSVCSSIIAGMPSGTTEEKLLYLHDYIITHCEYDTTKTQRSAYDCLVLGSAVCDGYSRAFFYLCRLAGLDVHVVISEKNNHSWNVAKVKSSGAYYYIDCTFDDPSTNKNLSHCLHDQFLMYKEKCTERHLYDDWINEDAESVYGYVTDETYRNSWWTKLIRPVQWVGSLMCYSKMDDYSHVFFRSSGSSTETAVSLPSGAAAPWSGYSSYGFITVASLNGSFYFSTPTQIWKLTTDRQMSLVYTLTAAEQAKGEIYGLQSVDGNLVYALAEEPTDAPACTGTLVVVPAMTAALSNGKPLVSWNAIPGATQVRVYRRSNTGGSWSGWENVAKVTSGTGWTDNNVVAGGKYKYRIKAYVGGAWTDYSNAELVELPQAPVMAVSVSADKAVVSWNAISGATQVRVYRRTCTGSTWGGWENVAKVTSGTSWADKSVTPGGKYKYQVKAYVGGAWTDYSNAETVAIPSAPVLKVGTTAISAKLSWNAVAGASKYRVYRRSNESGSWGGWENIAKLGSVTGWTDTTVIPGGKYKYQVKAYVGDAWTDYSNAVSVSIPSPPVMTVSATSGKITVSWNGIAGATQYRVYRRDNKGGTWSGWVTAAKLTSGTGWTDTGVTAGVQYKYRVRAYVGGEWTDYSNALTVQAK